MDKTWTVILSIVTSGCVVGILYFSIKDLCCFYPQDFIAKTHFQLKKGSDLKRDTFSEIVLIPITFVSLWQ